VPYLFRQKHSNSNTTQFLRRQLTYTKIVDCSKLTTFCRQVFLASFA